MEGQKTTPSGEGEVEETLSSEVGEGLFSDLVGRFVNPEVQRRLAAGNWNREQGVFMFQVLLHGDGDPEVRLNREIGGNLMATATRALEAGQDVALQDIAGVSRYSPRDEDAGVPHVTAFAHSSGWSIAFEFAGGHPSRDKFLTLAREFMETARQAHASGRLGPLVDNAFSAAELLAKAELLSCRPTVERVLNSRKHGGVARPYHLWANLGNTDARFAQLLKRLSAMRGPARYLDTELELSAREAGEIVDLLEAMEQHVTGVVDGTLEGEAPQSFNVYATREIRAGQLVGSEDFTLKPQRRDSPK